jgi:hyperosmotically inducible protein
MYGKVFKGFLLSFVILVTVTSAATAAMGQTNGRIVREVRHELVTLPYYGVFDWLQYEVRPDGEVVLHGQVVRPTTRSDAEGRVKEIDGVTR